MLEILLIFFIYLLGSKMWWLVGLVVFLNRWLQKSILLLIIFSPLFWISTFFDRQKFSAFNPSKMNFSFVDNVLFFSAGLLLCFVVYYVAIKFYSFIDRNSRHPLLYMLCLYAGVLLFGLFAKTYIQGFYFNLMWSMVCVFFSNAFVMMIYELKNLRRSDKLNVVESFALINTLHSNYIYAGGTQLSPRGTDHLVKSQVGRQQIYPLQIKALKLLAFCLILKVFTDVTGHLFLGLPAGYLQSLHVPVYQLVDLSLYKTVPRYFVMAKGLEHTNVYLAVAVRSLHWFSLRFIGWTMKIALLWFMGIYIELGMLNPFKSVSFVDFFRRSHVYLADFYRTFIYPYMLQLFSFLESGNFKKYLSIWVMIFAGGFIYETVSHYYQLFHWNHEQLYELMKNRSLYDAILATIICLSLYLEKKRFNPENKFVVFRTLSYIVVYSVIMSLSASNKAEGFTTDSLWSYLRILFGVN